MRIYIKNIFKEKKEKVVSEGVEENELNTKNMDFEKSEEKDERIYYTRKGAKANNIVKLNVKKEKNNKIKEENNKEENKLEDKKIKLNKYNLPKSYYALLTFMFLLAGASIHLLRKSNDNIVEENYAVFNNQTDNLNISEINSINNIEDNIQSDKTSNIDTRKELEKEEASASINVVTQVQQKVNTVVEKKVEPLVFAKPINGEILKIFSDDKVIYSKTLEMWKTHDGIDVKGKEGDIVYSIERGTVEKIYNDAFYGVTIVINHGQGYKSSYSNLSEKTFVEVGDKIKKSQKIGKIGTTSIGEIKDEPHLHFMLYENNIVADPSSIFE